jgi:hypothetical protein
MTNIVTTLLLAMCVEGNDLYTRKGDKERIYHRSYDEVWSACVKAANEHFSVAHSDKESGVLEFHTGISFTSSGFRVGVTLAIESEGVRVKLNTQKKRQLWAFGAGGRIAKKFWRAVDGILAPHPPAREPSSPTRVCIRSAKS